MSKTLFSLWQGHVQKGTCDPKFKDWCDFRAWCIKNKKGVADFEGVKMLQPESESASEKPMPEKTAKASKSDVKPKPASGDTPAAATTATAGKTKEG